MARISVRAACAVVLLILGSASEPAFASGNADAKREDTAMKVKFYRLDRVQRVKGPYLGTAELQNGKLSLSISDRKLKKLLSEPYATLSGVTTSSGSYDQIASYAPGTKEHLRSIALECYRYGYFGEIVDRPQ